jgi:hypothetical protein
MVCAALGASAAPARFPLLLGSGEKDLARYREYGYNAAVLGNFTELAAYEDVLPAGHPRRIAPDSSSRHGRPHDFV